MDELIIGEKTYLSSKRAAKITGYAKDYVGQLCREGRVECVSWGAIGMCSSPQYGSTGLV